MSDRRAVALYVPRRNHLKLFGPLIQALLDRYSREIAPLVVVLGGEIQKDTDRTTPAELRGLWPEGLPVASVDSAADLASLVHRERVRAVVSVVPRLSDFPDAAADALIGDTRAAGCVWAAVPYIGEQDLVIAERPAATAAAWDLIGLDGPASASLIERVLAGEPDATRQRYAKRLAIVGNLEFDGLGTLAPAAELRAKFGLPRDRPILFLATAPLFHAHGNPVNAGLAARFRGLADASWRGRIAALSTLGKPLVSYREYLAAIGELARRNDMLIVAKTRRKHADPPYVGASVDHLHADSTFYPFATLELLAISDLYVGFASACAFEALALGRYAINLLHLPLEMMFPGPFDRIHGAHHYTDPGAVWDCPGIGEAVRGYTAAGRDRLHQIARASLSDFRVDPDARQRSLDRYFGHFGASADRFVTELLARIDREGAARP